MVPEVIKQKKNEAVFIDYRWVGGNFFYNLVNVKNKEVSRYTAEPNCN